MPSAVRNEILWLTLSKSAGANLSLCHALLAHFGSIASLFAAPARELKSLLPEQADVRARLSRGPDEVELAAELHWLQDPTHHLLTWEDSEYPARLREIADPPILLYVKGDVERLAADQLAVVGSRNPTPAGRENARAFSRALAQAGYAITSGLAQGVDAAAHQGALDVGAATLAVLGTGIDRVYPPAHVELAHAIAARGALISEFAFGTPPLRENFPRRNRLISGLSLGTLVVEAAARSGSLITARLAGEQGREVFAIPGSIHSPLSRGCHALIRQGAKLVETAQDILEELPPRAVGERQSVRTREIADEDARAALAPEAARVLECLGYDPIDIDALVERSGLTPDTVSSMLLTLELRGDVAACPGGKYLRMSRSGPSTQ